MPVWTVEPVALEKWQGMLQPYLWSIGREVALVWGLQRAPKGLVLALVFLLRRGPVGRCCVSQALGLPQRSLLCYRGVLVAA